MRPTGYGTEPRAFLWRNGTMQDLGTLGGLVVGVTEVCSFVEAGDGCEALAYNAFLWERGSLVDLQTLLVSGSRITLSKSRGRGAYNINDRGEIAGEGALPNGDTRAVLLIPCDGNHRGITDCDYSLVDGTSRDK
jgi:uncharacterized membrane protein